MIINFFSISSHFCLPMLFSCGTTLVQIIQKINQTLLQQSSNSLLNSFPSEKLIDSIAKFYIRKLKIGFSIFDWVKYTIVYSLWIAAVSMRQDSLLLYRHIIFNLSRHSCSSENGKVLWLYHWYHPPHSIILAKFCNTTIIMILYLTCSIVFTTLSNQFLSLCSGNHRNWSVVVMLIRFKLTSQTWSHFSDVFIYIDSCS